MTGTRLTAALDICSRDIISERWRQLKKWGPQSHPDGTCDEHFVADWYRADCEQAFRDGTGTWRHILLEEVYEAMSETEYERLRAELVQVAAVAVAWIEDLDSRAGDREPRKPKPINIPASREMEPVA